MPNSNLLPSLLEDVVPATVTVGSAQKSLQLYLGELQKMIYEQYLLAFEEIGSKP